MDSWLCAEVPAEILDRFAQMTEKDGSAGNNSEETLDLRLPCKRFREITFKSCEALISGAESRFLCCVKILSLTQVTLETSRWIICASGVLIRYAKVRPVCQFLVVLYLRAESRPIPPCHQQSC